MFIIALPGWTMSLFGLIYLLMLIADLFFIMKTNNTTINKIVLIVLCIVLPPFTLLYFVYSIFKKSKLGVVNK